jgi:hypothetical protein
VAKNVTYLKAVDGDPMLVNYISSGASFLKEHSLFHIRGLSIATWTKRGRYSMLGQLNKG